MSATTTDLITDFFGTDPLRGEDAALELVHRLGPDAIEALVPIRDLPGSLSTQVEIRLKSVALRLGPAIAGYLARTIAEGQWHSKRAAAACYAGFETNPDIEAPLVAMLERGGDFDAERIAIEALTNLGADRWAADLVTYARYGTWRPGYPLDLVPISTYAFEKLSSYVLEALTRFVANARNRARVDSLFRLLTEFLREREQLLPNSAPTGYDLVERHTSRFTGWAIDPMIEHWGRSGNASLQRLCVDALRRVAPLRAAGFLLGTAIDRRGDHGVRTGASIALGDIRDSGAARLLADALRDPSVDRAHLDWAFSTLYAVPADWSGTDDFVATLIDSDSEVSPRLLYSLALRGERGIEPRLVARLDHKDSFTRWTAALSLARLLGAGSRAALQRRVDAASDQIERCGFLAALVRAGDETASARLHDMLREVTVLPLLQYVWKLEILDAFRLPPVIDPRAFRVWSDVARLNPIKVQYFEALVSSASAARPARSASDRQKLFISYAHEDEVWLKKFVTMLHPLIDNAGLEVWVDTRIQPGKWQPQIDAAMKQSRIALFLVSSHFLASEFITRTELPEFVRYAEERQVRILWALLDDCLWERSPLKAYQGDNIDQPLSLMSPGEQSRAIKKTSLRIEELLSASAAASSPPA